MLFGARCVDRVHLRECTIKRFEGQQTTGNRHVVTIADEGRAYGQPEDSSGKTGAPKTKVRHDCGEKGLPADSTTMEIKECGTEDSGEATVYIDEATRF